MRSQRSRAFCALILLLFLFGLCACRSSGREPEPTPDGSPAPSARVGLTGGWAGFYDAGDALMRELGVDLRERLPAPLLAEVQKGITVTPVKSWLSTKLHRMRGASPHQMG